MQSIGERLEDARKRKGISLREAAEGTKIRSDFLGHFEQNKFDFDLPELYKRGFIKNYARYLKLDPEIIINDYSAQLLSSSRNGNHSSSKKGSELFGQIEVKPSNTVDEDAQSNSSGYGRISAQSSSARSERDDGDEETDKTFYLKIGLVFIGTLTLVFVIFGLIKAILSSGDDPATNTDFAQPTEISNSVAPATPPARTSVAAASSNELTLIASGTVYVLVKQQADNVILYRDTMAEGDTVTLTKDGPVDILFTAGENITIESDGERLRPSSSGTAKIKLP